MKLYSLAQRWEKYLSKTAIDAEELHSKITEQIKQAIANASTVTPTSGVMPFIVMLDQDNAHISFMIIRNGTDITLQNFQVNPPDLTYKYQALPAQISKYLEKNWELFPFKYNGDAVNYKNFTFTLSYGGEQDIAAK